MDGGLLATAPGLRVPHLIALMVIAVLPPPEKRGPEVSA